MAEANDNALLREFAAQNSESAFAELVRRHINLVYSVAWRFTGNDSDAKDVAQAVFIILARKAARLSDRTVLTGWLYETTRFTAMRLLRTQARRRTYEQEASLQTILEQSAGDHLWQQLKPHLEIAMSRLGTADRTLLALRFYENKTGAEAAALLGIGEETARKRTSRALEKLRKFFAGRGVHSTTAIIANTISAHSIQAAPLGLANTISAVAITKGVAASASTLTLIKGALKIMAWTKAKTSIAVGIAAVVVGTGTWLVCHRARAHVFFSNKVAESVPVHIDNADFQPDGNRDGTFLVETANDTRRTTNSPAAIHIGGPLTPNGSTIAQMPFSAVGSYKKTDNSASTTYVVADGSILYGKRICVTGWLKTKDVKGWGSAFVIIIGKDGRHFQYDDMSDRPICGTTDWQQIQIVTDLPHEPCVVYFGPDLYGPGELWADDFQITLASPDAPVTDDRNWRIASEADPAAYSESTDSNITHNGQPAVCLAYTPDSPAPRGTHIQWSHNYYGSDSDKYRGHNVRMTGWLKTENISGRVEPVILPMTGWNKVIAGYRNDYIPKGTRDWTQFSVTCHVPDNTQYIRTGLNFYGSGKAWIDKDSITLEIVD